VKETFQGAKVVSCSVSGEIQKRKTTSGSRSWEDQSPVKVVDRRNFSRWSESPVRDVYREVTDQILAELKNGARPWVRTPGLNFPCNAVTGRPYSGINTLLLWRTRDHGWPQPRFLTFKQALEAGGHVRKGEHGYHIVFVKNVIRRDDEGNDEEPNRFRFLKSYTVFNLAQCDDLPNKLVTPPQGPNPHRRDVSIDEFITATGAKIQEEITANWAFYRANDDVIVLPSFKVFRGRPEYYATQFHELIHWTGHPSRLDRQLGARFGTRAKAAEELIAELGAAFLCAEFAIDGFVPDTAYIRHFLELLENDTRAIFTAASKAQAAVDFLRQLILMEKAA
jgi:antirestriction protein ArdC